MLAVSPMYTFPAKSTATARGSFSGALVATVTEGLDPVMPGTPYHSIMTTNDINKILMKIDINI